MASKNYFKVDASIVLEVDDLPTLPSCMNHHKSHDELKRNRYPDFGSGYKIGIKCNCSDPDVDHDGTILQDLPYMTYAEAIIEYDLEEWAEEVGI